MDAKIRLGISSCLLGNRVRYDGSHKLDPFLTGTLGKFVDYLPVCPEVECGFGVPREPVRLVGDPASPRLITVRTNADCTERMMQWARYRVEELSGEGLSGFIFKSKSPSSGMERVNLHTRNGTPVKKGIGVFARVFMERFPLIPVEDEGRLQNPENRENFIERIFVYKRWREMAGDRKDRKSLIEFHTKHKLLILAHSPNDYRALGTLTSGMNGLPLKDLYEQYQELLMHALRLPATVKKNTNVLQHAMGYFKNDLSIDEKQELLEIIGSYYKGHIPLIVPVTLISHYVRKYNEPYLKEQYYLNPHPIELRLRNHA